MSSSSIFLEIVFLPIPSVKAACIFLFLFYSIIIFRFILITLRAKGYFAKILSGSITSIFILLIITNISMAIGVLPVVGVTLPLLSLGGSSLLSIFFAFGIMFSIARRS